MAETILSKLLPNGAWMTTFHDSIIFSAEPTSNKTGSAPDPPTGEGCTETVDWTPQDQTMTWCSAPFSTPPPISSCKPLTLDVLMEAMEKVWKEMGGNPYMVSPAGLENFWKLKSGVLESPSGSSKHKEIRKSILEKGIL